jgi:hypothetical protein
VGKVTNNFSLFQLSGLKYFLGKVLEEVVLQDDADSLQQPGTDILSAEDVVDVGTFAIDFPGQPSNGFVSLFEHFLDFLSDVHNNYCYRVRV